MSNESALSVHVNWLPQPLLAERLDEEVAEWLLDQGSLTRRLTRLSCDHFTVVPLLEGWMPLRDDECSALGLVAGSLGWVREVYLRGHDQGWVFARSVAAQAALQASDLPLQELGSRSLGELLFSDREFVRGPIEICRYPEAWLPADCIRGGHWARRSRFSRQGLGVLVAEVFLPDLWAAAGLPVETC